MHYTTDDLFIISTQEAFIKKSYVFTCDTHISGGPYDIQKFTRHMCVRLKHALKSECVQQPAGGVSVMVSQSL